MTRRAAVRAADLNRALEVLERRGLRIGEVEIAPDGTIRMLMSEPRDAPARRKIQGGGVSLDAFLEERSQ
jgi:hypothetical protein